ncbi:MAG: transcription-repair coupling factor [Deltaproteobacteria bacterium]|nr:transcription-repair coupling factor [Deltaproteobacteria bacterium]
MSRRDAFLERAEALLRQGKGWSGLPRDALAFVLSQLVPGGRWLVVVDEEDAARALVDGLRFFLPPKTRVERFFADGGRPYDGFAPPREVVWGRLRALHLADEGGPLLVVATAAALAQRVPSAEALREGTLSLREGTVIERDALLAWLGAGGYLRVGAVEEPGTVAARGDVVDLWPMGRKEPVRVDFFDDEVEGVRRLDPATGRAREAVPAVRVVAALEERVDERALERANAALGRWVAEQGRGVQLRRRLVEELRGGYRPAALRDYLPALVPVRDPLAAFAGMEQVVVSPEDVRAALRAQAEDAARRWALLDEEERPLVPPDARFVAPEAVMAGLSGAQRVYDIAPPEVAVDLGARAPTGFGIRGADLAPAVARLRHLAEEGLRVGIAVEAGRLRALQELFAHHGLSLPVAASPHALRRQEVAAVVGVLHQGFVAEGSGWALIAAGTLFGNRVHTERARRAHALFDKGLSALSELKKDDLVVHRVHGLGRYQGLARVEVEPGVEQDFVRLSYRDGDLLYLPATQLQAISRYASSRAEGRIKLDKLGGVTWERRRRRVKDSILAMAQHLLELQARRELSRRPPVPAPGPLYRAVEARFPWEETPDQARAIEEIHEDLNLDRPMDRLLCGDVGFGQTEVALRAAVRVVESGRQVAVLCPTTVLAYQHLQTFRARLEGLPVRVEMVSRFVDDRAEKAALKDLREGRVDVVIGTSRLLGRAVRFQDLGLVVVDEEHRFGVRQKERLKQWRAEVDLLAMSSTPIPRSLEQAVTGVRALSVMNTPPTQRLSVRTVVARDGRDRVRDAILRELEREGQVFVVHNRVESIDQRAAQIAAWVPEARVGVAHGQLSDEALEAAMLSFVRGDVDVLVASTIIESGVDLPNVNTMIVDRADQLGLAQLYQLRGRVGRGDKRATALLLAPEELSRDARKRLQVILENTHLGAGLEIASADLELRGAGNLLGEAQSGNIHEVGYEVWLELLQEAVEEARGHQEGAAIEPIVEVRVPAFIPERLIPEVRERLGWYKRISSAETPEEVDSLLEDLEGWVGELPAEVRNLGGLVQTGLYAKGFRVIRVAWLKVRVVLELHPTSPLAPILGRIATATPSRFTVRDGLTLEVRFRPEEAEQPLPFLRWMFTRLAAEVRQRV